MSETLDNVFGIPADQSAPVTTPPVANTTIATVPADATDEEKLEKDFAAAQAGIQQGIKDVTEAMKSAILLAQSGDSPRAYEVVAKMLDSVVTANKELILIHQNREEAKTAKNKNTPAGVAVVDGKTGDSVAFVGRADELLRKISEMRKLKKQEIASVTPAPIIQPAKEAEPAVDAEVVEVK